MIRADRGDVQIVECGRSLLRRNSTEGLCVLVEREERDDRKRGYVPYGCDCGGKIVQVVERLDHEQVDASPLQELRLLGKDRAPLLMESPDLAEGADRPCDEHVLPRDLTGVPGDLHRGFVDHGDVVLEVVLCELSSVCAERVRLDELCAGADEPEVEREDALGGAQIGLLGAAEPRNGARDEHAHTAVGHDRGPLRKTLEEPVGHPRQSKCRGEARSSTHSGGLVKPRWVTPSMGE